MPQSGGNKRGAGSRAARLEAELRANLKKRKAQARARAGGATQGEAAPDSEKREDGNG